MPVYVYAYCESFNSRLRDGLLNREEFASELEAKVLSAEWRRHYNEQRSMPSAGALRSSDSLRTPARKLQNHEPNLS